MPIIVNGELVPRELIAEESRRLAQTQEWQDSVVGIADEFEKQSRLQTAAEWAAIDRVLITQELRKDDRPIDPVAFEREVKRVRAEQGAQFELTEALRSHIELNLRTARIMSELAGDVPRVTQAETQKFYRANRERFQDGGGVEAAHILKRVDELHTESEAMAGISEALAALESGEGFASVVERFSDCRENGGQLGRIVWGDMVPSFERVVFSLAPGQRSGIFRTEFGFHIAEVSARVKSRTLPLRAVQREIEGFLLFQRHEQALVKATLRLREKSDIRRVWGDDVPKPNQEKS